ncbi:hypothetical protein CF319_g1052 [Tilletia indica]|nr:hypothetical protein CF319_g1052 [Tilletia indica]
MKILPAGRNTIDLFAGYRLSPTDADVDIFASANPFSSRFAETPLSSEDEGGDDDDDQLQQQQQQQLPQATPPAELSGGQTSREDTPRSRPAAPGTPTATPGTGPSLPLPSLTRHPSTWTLYSEPRRPFAHFLPKVRTLVADLQARHIIPPARNVDILRVTGGSLHRIFRLVLDGDGSRILRVPRRSGYGAERVARMIRWLNVHTDLPVPRILAWDGSTENPLRRPWMLTTWIPGVTLKEALPEMTVEQRCEVAVQLANITADILSVPVPNGIGPLFVDDDGKLKIGHYDFDDMAGEAVLPSSSSNHTVPRTALDFMRQQFVAANDFIRTLGPPRSHVDGDHLAKWHRHGKGRMIGYESILDGLARIFEHSPPAEQRAVLQHPDLSRGNIIVDQIPPSDSNPSRVRWKITGIIDWDDCKTLPVEAAYQLPSYIWTADATADKTPETHIPDPSKRNSNESEIDAVREAYVDAIAARIPDFVTIAESAPDCDLAFILRLSSLTYFPSNIAQEVVDQAERIASEAAR